MKLRQSCDTFPGAAVAVGVWSVLAWGGPCFVFKADPPHFAHPHISRTREILALTLLEVQQPLIHGYHGVAELTEVQRKRQRANCRARRRSIKGSDDDCVVACSDHSQGRLRP